MLQKYQELTKLFEKDGFEISYIERHCLSLKRTDGLEFRVRNERNKFNFYLFDLGENINVSVDKSIERIYSDVNKRLIVPNETKWQDCLNKKKKDEEHEARKFRIKSNFLTILQTTCYKDSYEFSKLIENELLVRVRINGIDSIKLELDYLSVELTEKIIVMIKESVKND